MWISENHQLGVKACSPLAWWLLAIHPLPWTGAFISVLGGSMNALFSLSWRVGIPWLVSGILFALLGWFGPKLAMSLLSRRGFVYDTSNDQGYWKGQPH